MKSRTWISPREHQFSTFNVLYCFEVVSPSRLRQRRRQSRAPNHLLTRFQGAAQCWQSTKPRARCTRGTRRGAVVVVDSPVYTVVGSGAKGVLVREAERLRRHPVTVHDVLQRDHVALEREFVEDRSHLSITSACSSSLRHSSCPPSSTIPSSSSSASCSTSWFSSCLGSHTRICAIAQAG